MSKEKFNAGELTKEDMLIINDALCNYYTKHCDNDKVLEVIRKIVWLLYYVNWKTIKCRSCKEGK